jgi:DNA-directed RNA polymerase subunit H (RpoH/RPB5)
LSKAMNTRKTRSLLSKMNAIKAQMIRISNNDPKLMMKMNKAGLLLENLRMKLRSAQNEAYRNFMAKKR